MKGIELSRKYFETFGKNMLETQFPELLPYLAVGFVGSGSEHYGYDDEISRDHDFEPGFCIFIPDESVIDERKEFLLSRAYQKLPKDFEGFRRQTLSPVGGNRNGVIRTGEFYTNKVGSPIGELSAEQWLAIPEHYLADATDGDVFFDNYGEFTDIRNKLLSMPEDIRLKRLAGNLIVMAQAGEYNYARCLSHGEPEAAQLALNTFVDAASRTFFLLNSKYMPFYKWQFRAMRALTGGEAYAKSLSTLLVGDIYDKQTCNGKSAVISNICAQTIESLRAQNLTKSCADSLEPHAYSVNDGIKDSTIRNMSVFAAM